MAWTNLFDLGECTVRVSYQDAPPLFEQVMSKGDQAQFTDSYGDGPFTISVDQEGRVTLDQWWFDTRVDIAVIPAYDHDYPARIRGAVLGGSGGVGSAGSARGAINHTGRFFWGGVEGVDFLQYETTSPAVPEPLDMTSLTGLREGVFLAVTGGGG